MKLLLLSLLFSFLSFITFAQSTKGSVDEAESEIVSLIRLIANPEKYDGKKIQVVGYLHLELKAMRFICMRKTIKKTFYKIVSG